MHRGAFASWIRTVSRCLPVTTLIGRLCHADDEDLKGWPKAILVVSSQTAIKGAPRREDEVIAASWRNWVPEIVLEGLLEGLVEADAGP